MHIRKNFPLKYFTVSGTHNVTLQDSKKVTQELLIQEPPSFYSSFLFMNIKNSNTANIFYIFFRKENNSIRNKVFRYCMSFKCQNLIGICW